MEPRRTDDSPTAAARPRPRVLLALGVRLGHGALGEALRRVYDVREVGDHEAAWQAILLDASIRVAIIDFSATAVRGHDLLERLRASKVHRVHDTPVITLLERNRAAEAERIRAQDATEMLVGDGPESELIDQLQARVRVLVELADTRDALVESRAELDSVRTVDPETELLAPAAFDKQIEKLLSYARRALSDLALICIRVELKLPHHEVWDGESEQRMKLVGRTLGASIRLEDLATRSGQAEFCVAVQNNGMTDMLRFAARLRKVLENVDAAGPGVEVWTSVGVATLSEELHLGAAELRGRAQRRALLAQSSHSRRIILGGTDAARPADAEAASAAGSMDIGLALALLASGRGAEVVPHLPRLIQQINPLLRLIREQQRPAAAPGAGLSPPEEEGK